MQDLAILHTLVLQECLLNESSNIFLKCNNFGVFSRAESVLLLMLCMGRHVIILTVIPPTNLHVQRQLWVQIVRNQRQTFFNRSNKHSSLVCCLQSYTVIIMFKLCLVSSKSIKLFLSKCFLRLKLSFNQDWHGTLTDSTKS